MAITISGTDGIVGAGFTVDNSGVSVTAGVGTFSSIGAGTSIAAAGLHGTMPTIDGSALTSLSAANLECEPSSNHGVGAGLITILKRSSNRANPF